MYAVIQTGGKQYRVEEGSVIDVELLPGEKGDSVSVEKVLLVSDDKETKVGRPSVEGASVQLEILGHTKGPKVTTFKKIRRHGKQLKKGHRQQLVSVRVASISS